MIPMIDLLMVTISFLLITAVWVHAHRLEADANVPGTSTLPPCDDCKEDAKLHVDTKDPTTFVLAWKQGPTVLRTVDVPRDPRRKSFPALAAKVTEEWRTAGLHRGAEDKRFDRAVVHASNDMHYDELVAVMDAVAAPKRTVSAAGKLAETNAFYVTFATD